MQPELTSITSPRPHGMPTSGTSQHEDGMEIERPISPQEPEAEGIISEQEQEVLDEAIYRRNKGMNSYQWESWLVPQEAPMEIRKAPHSTKYDGRFLLVVENWIILLTRYSSLEYDTPSPENPWPFALTRLNYLIKRCQKILFDSEEWYYMDDRFEDPRPELLSPWAQPAIENEVEMARLVIGELLLSKFGSWLADINQRNIWNFGNGRPFYNVDYDNMDLEFVTFGPGGIIYHIRSYLEIGLLFLDERTKELSGYSMRNMNERPFIAFGIGGDGHDQYLFQDDDDDYDDFDDDDDESYTLGNDSDRDDNDGDSKSNIATNGGSSGNSDSDMSFFELNDMQRSNASGITPEELDKSGSPGMIDPGATKPLTRLEIESMNLRFAELENRMLRLELRVEHTTRMCDQFAIFSGDMIEKMRRPFNPGHDYY